MKWRETCSECVRNIIIDINVIALHAFTPWKEQIELSQTEKMNYGAMVEGEREREGGR